MIVCAWAHPALVVALHFALLITETDPGRSPLALFATKWWCSTRLGQPQRVAFKLPVPMPLGPSDHSHRSAATGGDFLRKPRARQQAANEIPPLNLVSASY